MGEQDEQAARTEPTEPNGDEGAKEPVDWEQRYRDAIAHSRDWERKAKANNKAASELAELKKAQMSELERATAERDEYKALAEALRAEKERAAWASEVSEETGVPSDVLAMISAENRDELMEKAQSISGLFAKPEAPAVPVVLGDGNHARETGGVSANDFFRAKFQHMNR